MPRKTLRMLAAYATEAAASMRPRPDAAENIGSVFPSPLNPRLQ